jgi:membrane protease YdiL (CAAX protease family)
MSASFSSNPAAVTPVVKKPRTYRWWLALALPAWVFVSFVFAQILVVAIITALRELGVVFTTLNTSVLETVAAAVIYLLCFGVIVSLPLWVKGFRTTREDVGLTRLPSWMDLGLAPAGFVIYLLVSALMMYIVAQLASGFNAAESQDIGFQDLTKQYEYVLAFVTLVMIAPIAEEAIFRGYLYGKLRKSVPIWVAIGVTSLLFGLLHMKWDGGLLAGANVGLDVFVLSVVMCSLREVTGSIWAGIVLHMMKNGLAFYLLFINTALLSTMGG